MKQKVFVQKASLPRSSSKGDLERSKSKRRLSGSYRNNLPSESNQETPSNSESEKSWVLDSQKKLVSKSADYTRKKKRVRSKLKVLPLSSPSSGSDHRGKKVGSSPRGEQRMEPSTELYDFATMQPPMVSSTPISHVRHNDLEMAGDTLPSHLSPNSSEAGASKKHEAASSTLPMEDKVSKSKRKFSDLSAGTSGKCSKLTRRQPRDECSPTIPFVARKLFNSPEMEEETREGD
uniref:uncharacterized protein LOC114600083 n=1 Tax=Podarcis muralis TaxID=64176 RepID=UPI00109F2902|nr:uncharacterized protein LOC114600083 [Podarcis muralis]